MTADEQVALAGPPAPGQLGEELGEDYWSQSRRPWPSLLFLTPLLIVYEGGVLLESSAAARNGADLWLRRVLDSVGLGHYFLLPLLLVGILLAWHYTSGQSWRVSPTTLLGMAVECSLLSVALWGLLRWQGSLWQLHPVAGSTGWPGWLVRTISYLGAGLYEELLFRLILLPAMLGLFRLAGLGLGESFLAAALSTSGLFALAHHLGPAGDPWNLAIFSFRWLAGMFFCGLFWFRGFGIAAGTHAGYDILVGVLLP
ncbi:MAG: CPBP family intramembrane glutamic endopeptidase [Thermoguttaceae bacterium]|nr:CPBP family intramembrane glutamic endopeptidase [Thermoguttaceae bacterium]